MDDSFENIILDEEDNLNEIESLREKYKNKDGNKENSNKEINIIKKESKTENEIEDKETSEQYNDFDYNIEEKEIKDKETEKENEFENENNNPINNHNNNFEFNSDLDLKNNNENSISEKNIAEKDDNENENENEIIINNNDEKKEQIIKKEKENIINNKIVNDNKISKIKGLENNFSSIKNDLEYILKKDEFDDIKEISEQNKRLIEYISKLNEIMNSIIEIYPKGEKLLIDKISKIRRTSGTRKKTKEEKSKKILEIYKNEYIDLENKNRIIKDPIYKESIKSELNKLKREYEIIFEENKKLKEAQKINEINIEKNSKYKKKELNDIKRIEMNINNIKSQMILLKKKINKNNVNIIENNKRINQYIEKEKNLDNIAKEKYGIKEYQDVNFNQNDIINKYKEKKNSLKKIEIYEKGIETNKNKYQREIKNNEIIINNLQNEKIKLLYSYRELIGEEKFRNIINTFKEEMKKNENKKSDTNIKEEIKTKIEDNISNSNNNKDKNNNERINIDKDESKILEKKENQDNQENNASDISNKKNNIKYPAFLDSFKEEDINLDSNNNESSEKEEEKEEKDEKIINLVKFDEINDISNRKEDENEEESPPNEYEDLEEFQI